MPRSTSALVCSAISCAAGIWAFVTVQAVTKEAFEPIMEACTSSDYATMEEFVEKTGYHAWDQHVGLKAFDFLVCLITQFLLDLTKMHPAGMIVWATTLIVAFPVAVLMSLEAGRQHSKGLILWPTFNGLLMQLFGISVIFPALWVPAYTYGGSDKGVVNATLAKIVFFMALPGAALSALVFYLDTNSDLWTTCAGVLGGPMLVLTSLIIWVLPPPKSVTDEVADQTAESSALGFAAAGIASLLAWVYVVYTAMQTYGWDFAALSNDLWWEAHPCVKFMTIDASVLYLGLVLHIGSRNLRSMVEALLGTLIFGPGAACALALTSIELNRESETAPTRGRDPTKKDQ